jgi:hypothetical protein
MNLSRISPPKTLGARFVPALELQAWVRENILDPEGKIHNPDFLDLLELNIGFLWTDVRFKKGGARILGTCSLADVGGDAWSKGRREQQIEEWFGEVFDDDLDFLITLYAPFAEDADMASVCAVVEHELYHCGIKKYVNGKPVLETRRHDVEEFIGVVRRYGAFASSQPISELVAAAKKEPEIARATLEGVCGSCGREIA